MPTPDFGPEPSASFAGPRKTNFFGTYLSELSSASGQRPLPAAFPASPPPGAGAAAPTPEPDTLDAIVKTLASLNGEASVKDLVGVAGNSIGKLLAGIQNLQAFNLVTFDGAAVRLTPEGTASAHSLA